MTTEVEIIEMEARKIAQLTAQQGWGHFPSRFFIQVDRLEDLIKFQASYYRLPLDERGGQRRRAYTGFTSIEGQVTETQEYLQSKKYNQDLGGIVRIMAPIEHEVKNLSLFKNIISADIEIAKQMNIVNFDAVVKIGVHVVRYLPTQDDPSYSSPPWLHQDDEPIVFIHQINKSSNAIGGDSIIAEKGQKFAHVHRLEGPLDTLCVTNTRNYHAVTPLGVSTGVAAFRDILLVTFENVSIEA